MYTKQVDVFISSSGGEKPHPGSNCLKSRREPRTRVSRRGSSKRSGETSKQAKQAKGSSKTRPLNKQRPSLSCSCHNGADMDVTFVRLSWGYGGGGPLCGFPVPRRSKYHFSPKSHPHKVIGPFGIHYFDQPSGGAMRLLSKPNINISG